MNEGIRFTRSRALPRNSDFPGNFQTEFTYDSLMVLRRRQRARTDSILTNENMGFRAPHVHWLL